MNREELLDNWLRNILKIAHYQRQPLAGDASLRRYYRIHLQEGESWVVMDAPFPESPLLFVEIAQLLEVQGLKVPRIVASDFSNGFLLLSDFGDRLYLNELNEKTAAFLYEESFLALIQMQNCKSLLPRFDKTLAKQELETLFKGWYLKTHLRVEDDTRIKALDPILDSVINVIEAQPKVFMHRDYHSRNLMVLETSHHNYNRLGILDFQDALRGPITYDLVSLLQDCYIAWPRAWVEDWVWDFQQRLEREKLLSQKISKQDFLRWFDLTGLQRHLKNLGIFSRKYHRDNNPNYLKNIPMPLKYIHEALQRYAELKPLADFFKDLKIFETDPSIEISKEVTQAITATRQT